LQTAKTQRWPPHELLATLVREEIASREASNERARLKAAGFPAPKTLESFDIKVSSLPRPTFEFLASLEWLERKDNLCLAGPAGVGKSHLAQALGRVAITAGRKVRFFAADQLVEALYRGLADNTVGKLIERLLRHDFIVIDDLGYTALDRVAADHLFRFIAAAYEQRSIAITTNVEFECWTQFLPDAASSTAILDRFLHHCHVITLDGESYASGSMGTSGSSACARSQFSASSSRCSAVYSRTSGSAARRRRDLVGAQLFGVRAPGPAPLRLHRYGCIGLPVTNVIVHS